MSTQNRNNGAKIILKSMACDCLKEGNLTVNSSLTADSTLGWLVDPFNSVCYSGLILIVVRYVCYSATSATRPSMHTAQYDTIIRTCAAVYCICWYHCMMFMIPNKVKYLLLLNAHLTVHLCSRCLCMFERDRSVGTCRGSLTIHRL